MNFVGVRDHMRMASYLMISTSQNVIPNPACDLLAGEADRYLYFHQPADRFTLRRAVHFRNWGRPVKVPNTNHTTLSGLGEAQCIAGINNQRFCVTSEDI
jgi:hypothetical protein